MAPQILSKDVIVARLAAIVDSLVALRNDVAAIKEAWMIDTILLIDSVKDIEATQMRDDVALKTTMLGKPTVTKHHHPHHLHLSH